MSRIPNSSARISLRPSAEWLRAGLSVLAYVGEGTRAQGRKLVQLAGLVCAVVLGIFSPSNWQRTIRIALARNIVSSGVEAIGIVCVLAIALGVLLVVQYQLWLEHLLHSRFLGSILDTVVVRELAPLLVNLVVIARSGSAMTAELALVHVAGEDRIVEGLGLDPLAYFVLPRTLGLVISTACLTLIFIAVSFLSVYIGGQWLGVRTDFLDFTRDTLSALSPADLVNLVIKSTLPALLAGCICCAEGLGAGDSNAEVPRACRIGVQRSVITLFIVTALVSVLAYL